MPNRSHEWKAARKSIAHLIRMSDVSLDLSGMILDALIKRGWTPPKQVNGIRESDYVQLAGGGWTGLVDRIDGDILNLSYGAGETGRVPATSAIRVDYHGNILPRRKGD